MTRSSSSPIEGCLSKGVENSLEALEAAAKEKAAYAEMDILLTKDHQFVVMHDYNLKRLAGVDKDVKDMTLAEVQGLKIQQDGHTSHIPSFEEYVKRAKELKMKLLVELKSHMVESLLIMWISLCRRCGT